MSAPNSVTGALSQVAIQALPPDIQNLLNQKGKTSDRIKAAIAWASRPDARVLARHQKRDPSIKRFEDIRSASLAKKDAVARSLARDYRRRAAVTGAVTGLPGGAWAIVAAGADVQLTAIYAVRMAASVAQAYGYNTTDLQEQAELADVLAIAAGVDTLRGVGQYLSRQGLVHLLPEILPRILTRLSLKLTEEQAAKWVGRLIPGFGALIGGSIDYGFLRVAGDRAVAHYHNRILAEGGMLPAGAAQAALPPPASAAASAEQRSRSRVRSRPQRLNYLPDRATSRRHGASSSGRIPGGGPANGPIRPDYPCTRGRSHRDQAEVGLLCGVPGVGDPRSWGDLHRPRRRRYHLVSANNAGDLCRCEPGIWAVAAGLQRRRQHADARHVYPADVVLVLRRRWRCGCSSACSSWSATPRTIARPCYRARQSISPGA